MAADGTDGSADGTDMSADGTNEVGGRGWVGGRHRWVGRAARTVLDQKREDRHPVLIRFSEPDENALGSGFASRSSYENDGSVAGRRDARPPSGHILNPFFTSTRTPIATAIRGKMIFDKNWAGGEP